MSDFKTPDEIRLRPAPDGYVHPDFADPYIVCAACKWDDLVIASARHFSPVMRELQDRLGIDRPAHEQGFIDQLDRFWTREEALEIMTLTGQPIKDEEMCQRRMFSEGLY